MRIAVLGPLETAGTRLSPRERTALSVLALRSPGVVGADEIADVLWGDHPPGTWPKQVQVCVSRMRAKLPPHTVETTGHGYRLAADGPDDLDVRAFESTVAQARGLLGAAEPSRAATAYGRALSLWRGRAFDDIADWPGAEGERERLTALRLQVQEEWLEARLAAGQHGAVAVDARRLVAQEPLRERRWWLLALAHYRCGRQGEALATLRRARHTLAQELGVDPGHDLVELEADILQHADWLQPPAPAAAVSAVCPYQGLTPFDPDDQEVYFGRREEVEHCVARLRATGHLVLTGASGSGKTSLLRAGVMAALARSADAPVYLVPGSDPLDSLYAALEAAPPEAPLVVDQLEELFLLGHPHQVVAEYCRQLVLEAARRPLALGIRVDQLGELGVDQALGVIVEHSLHLVRPLDEDQLREVIEGPAASAGLRVEPGLVDLLLRDAAEGQGALPLLSHTLVEIWKHRDGGVLTVDGYRSAGGLSGAVARTADALYEQLPEQGRAACRSVLLHLVELPEAGQPICHRLPRHTVEGDPSREAAVASLVRARLLTVQEDSVEVAHEALVRAWPRLRSWLHEDAEQIRALRHLAVAAQAWDDLGRPSSELYRGARLQTALRLPAGDTTTPLEQEFLAASEALHRAELERAQRMAARERRGNRRLRLLLVSTTGLLVLALVAGALALSNRNRAVEERSSAQLEALVGRSLALRATDRDTAALLAVEAYRRYPDDARARSALLATFTVDPGFLGYRDVQGASRLDGTVLPDGATAVVVMDGQRVVTMDVATGRTTPLGAGAGTPGQVSDAMVRASADGASVAVLSGGVLTVDRVEGGERLLGPVNVSRDATLALSPDGTLVATTEGPGAVVVRRVSDGTQVGRVPAVDRGDVNGAAGVAFLPTGELVVGSRAGSVRVVDVPDLSVRLEVAGPPEAADLHVVPVSEDVVVTAGTRRLAAFDPRSGEVRWRVDLRRSGPEPCHNLVVATPMGTLYCGDLFGVIEERDLTTGGLTGRRFDVQRNDVGDLAVADGGRELVSFGAFDPVLARWRLDGSGPVTTLLAAGYAPMDGFEPEGRLFVAARRPTDAVQFDELTEFAVWDVAADRPVSMIEPAPMLGMGWVDADTVMGFYPPEVQLRRYDARSGQLLSAEPLPPGSGNFWPTTAGGVYYLTYDDGRVETMDPGTGERIGPSFRVDGGVSVLASSPDGARIAVVARTDDGGVLTLHDAATGERLAGPVEGVDRVAVSDRAVAGARGGAVTIYDPRTLEAVHDLPGARGEVNLLAFDAAGDTLLATSNDQTVSVYDTGSWTRLGDPIPADAPLIFPAYLHPSGDSLLVTVALGVARWQIDAETLRAAACAVAGRDLTRTEWAAYLAELGPYRQTCPA